MFGSTRRHIRSSTAKKDILRKWTHAQKSIHNIRSWPPGAFMLYDNTDELGKNHPQSHVGVGIVVANNGDNLIRVIWGANCHRTFCEYEVDKLNPKVIFHVG